MAFTKVAALDDLWGGEMTARIVAGRKILLVRIGDHTYAYEDRCAHLGVALSEGRLDGDVLTCSAHDWQYDVRSGKGINPASACLTPFAVRIEAGNIMVDVDRSVR
jgi:toluene monooxygenase system ferredoxin subunit